MRKISADRFVYLENPRNSTESLLQAIRKYSKLVWKKIKV